VAHNESRAGHHEVARLPSFHDGFSEGRPLLRAEARRLDHLIALVFESIPQLDATLAAMLELATSTYLRLMVASATVPH
jgi:hypothetical protein